MRNDLSNWLSGTAASNVAPLAARPGWTGPVLAAKRSAPRDGLGLPAMSIEGASAIIAARQEAAVAAGAGILVEMRETGKLFGLRLFTEVTDALIAEVRQALDHASADDLAEDIPAMLARFQAGALAITAVHAAARGDRPANEAGLAHWTAACTAYAEHILRFLHGILREMAKTIDDPSAAEAWGEDLADVVMAFTFPGFGAAPKDEAWRRARTARFEVIRQELHECRAARTA